MAKSNIVVSISGLIGSGKDTAAAHLITEHGFQKLSFASSLKDAVAVIFGWERSLLEGDTAGSREWRETVDEWWANRLGMPQLTPRWVLQHWGTEVVRTHFHDEMWVASVENKIRRTTENIVITDCRFRNEIALVKNLGGMTCRISRGPDPAWYPTAFEYNKGPEGNMHWATGKRKLDKMGIHASEYSSVGVKYDHLIDNNDTVDALCDRMDSIIHGIRRP